MIQRALCSSLILLLAGAPAWATGAWRADAGRPKGCAPDVVVVNANDAGAGSLRAAIAGVCADGLILFQDAFAINLASELVIDKALTIDGSDASVTLDAHRGSSPLVQINGGPEVRSFRIVATGNLTLRRMRISNGSFVGGGPGAGIHNRGSLTVLDSRMDGNAVGPSGVGGGAIFNDLNARLRVEGSSFDRNTSGRGSAIFNLGDAELRNSTFSGNFSIAGLNEGAIQNRGTLLGVHLTIADNGDAGNGFGAFFAFNAETTLINSILTGISNRNCFFSGGTLDDVALLATNGNCTPELTLDPQLQALADNGGATLTMALGADSPAVDVGDPDFCLPTDQRGASRPQNQGCDLGAFELEGIGIFGNGFEGSPVPVALGR